MEKIYLNDQEQTIYLNDPEQFYLSTIVPEQYFAGTNVFNNCNGETVLIESWTNTTTNVNPVNNFKTFTQVSNVQIQNLDKPNKSDFSYCYPPNGPIEPDFVCLFCE
jgi:hypothetical protein